MLQTYENCLETYWDMPMLTNSLLIRILIFKFHQLKTNFLKASHKSSYILLTWCQKLKNLKDPLWDKVKMNCLDVTLLLLQFKKRFYIIFKSYFEFLIPLCGSIVLFYCWDYKTFYNLLHLKKFLMIVFTCAYIPFSTWKKNIYDFKLEWILLP